MPEWIVQLIRRPTMWVSQVVISSSTMTGFDRCSLPNGR